MKRTMPQRLTNKHPLAIRLLGVAFASSMVAACGTDDPDLITDSMAALCNSYCDSYPKQVDGCPDNTNFSSPKQTCKSQCSLYLDTNSCRADMQAYAKCNEQRVFECVNGSNLYTVGEDDPCEDLEDAFGFTAGDASSAGRCVDVNAL